MKPNIEDTIETVFGFFELHGNEEYIGEPVSQLEHATQAAQLAERAGADEETILAALFHDFGHLCTSATAARMDGYGIVSHEKVGADYLRQAGFSEKIARLVESHVQAKRYLTFKNPDYYENLSEASQSTLAFQGGRMTAQEAAGFEADVWFPLYLQMRYWDEQAKEMHVPVPDLGIYKAMAERHLVSNSEL